MSHTNVFAGWHFLIVDDNIETLKLLQVIFERGGVRVTCAEDSEQAFERAIETQPDMIITDLARPKLNRWGLIAKLKHDDRTRAIPVVVLTAYMSADDRERAAASGIDHFLIKPITPKALMHELSRVIARSP